MGSSEVYLAAKTLENSAKASDTLEIKLIEDSTKDGLL